MGPELVSPETQFRRVSSMSSVRRTSRRNRVILLLVKRRMKVNQRICWTGIRPIRHQHLWCKDLPLKILRHRFDAFFLFYAGGFRRVWSNGGSS